MGGFLARTAEKKPCAVRTACCGLSFIVCSGPLLILIAVVLYFIPYQAVRFTPKVYEYNVQVAQFLTRLNFIQSTSFEISTTFIYDKLTLASRLPPIEGDRIGIANQPSLIHAGSTGTFFALASGKYNVRARTTAGTEKQRISVPTSNNQTFQVVCTWASPCTDINQDFCPEGYNSYSGSNVCEKDTTCGTCSGRLYVLQMCIQVENTLPLSFPLTRQGCAYPFGGRFGDYSSPTPLKEISVQFMSQDDPYVHLQLITKGTNDFGVSYETLEILKDIAVAMFGIGCLIIVITILILALVFFRRENRRNLMLIYGRVLGVKDVVEYRDNQYAVPEKQLVHSTMPQQMGNGMMQPQQQMGNGMMQPQQQMGNGMISRQPSMGNGMMQPQQQMGNGMRPSGTMNVAPNGMMQPQQQMGNGMRPSGTMNLPGNGADQRQPSMGNSLQRPGMENQTFGTMRPVAPLTTNPMDAFHTPMKLH